MRRARVTVLTALACALAAPAWAQPERGGSPAQRGEQGRQRGEPDRPRGEPRNPRDGFAPDRDAPPGFDGRFMRQRIQDELERSRRDTERYERALRRLDEGDAPPEVWRQMREQRDEHPVIREITDDDRARVIAYLREHAPQMGERLAAAAKDHPRGADFIIGRVLAQLHEIDRLRAEDPEMGEVRESALHVGLQMRQAVMRLHSSRHDGDEAGETEAENTLRGLIGEQFDLDGRARESEIRRLSEELDRMRAEHEQRLAQRDQIIEEQLEKVKNDPHPGGPPGRGPDGDRPGRSRRHAPDDAP